MAGTAFIGLDFGSSLIKVAIRLEGVGTAIANHRESFGIAFEGTGPSGPYSVFRPTALWVIGDGPARRICVVPPARPDRALEISGIKERLLADYASLEPEQQHPELPGTGLTAVEATALLIASTLQQVRQAITIHCKEVGAFVPGNFLVNCAIPSSDTLQTEAQDGLSPASCRHRIRFRDLVERVRRKVFIDGFRMPDAEPDLATAKQHAAALMETPLPTDEGEMGTACLPESLAAVLAAASQRQFQDGLYFVFDVGAYTTDASLFFFHPRPEYRIMCYYAIGTCRAGIGRAMPGAGKLVEPRRLALERELQRMYEGMLDVMMRQYGDEYVKAMLCHVPRYFTPRWRAVLMGGGASLEAVRSIVNGLHQPSNTPGEYRTAPMATPVADFPRDSYSSVVFMNQRVGRRVHRIEALRQHPRQYLEALGKPSNILQLAIGLAQNVMECPTWCASTPATPDNRPPAVSADAWKRFNPWTGL